MQIGSRTNTYEWQDSWAAIPESESARTGWSHHGVTVLESGEIISYHPGDPTMMVFDPDGTLVRTGQGDLRDAHGITVVKKTARNCSGSPTTAANANPASATIIPVTRCSARC